MAASRSTACDVSPPKKGVATETFNASWIATNYDDFLKAFNTKTKDQWHNKAEWIGNETGDKILNEAGALK